MLATKSIDSISFIYIILCAKQSAFVTKSFQNWRRAKDVRWSTEDLRRPLSFNAGSLDWMR